MPVTGLTLGKFAPLHAGHQLVLETALGECDEVTCLVYDSPDVTDIPLSVRAGWIAALYPRVRVVEARGGPVEMGDTPEIQRAHERFVQDDLGIRRVDRFYSSEFYGAHMSRALGALDRRVDPERKTVPIAGAAIRADPFRYRRFLHPRVYRDYVTTVVFLGAPCTGKSTLAERLARDLETVFMPEYGREYWDQHQVDRRLTPGQLVEIAEGHLEREDALIQEARRFLFVDTNALTTAVFARYYHGAADPKLVALADSCPLRYDLVFLCEDDFPYDDTWDRSGPANRTLMQAMVVQDLAARGITAIRLSGSLDARVAAATRVLAAHRKWGTDRSRTCFVTGVTYDQGLHEGDNMAAGVSEMATSAHLATEDDLRAMPEDGRKYELVDGEVQESPAGSRHGQIALRLGARLLAFVDEKGLGHLFDSSTGFRLPGGNVRSPDVSFVARSRFEGGVVPEGFSDVPPDLAVEVLSPQDRPRPVFDKVGEYVQAKVRLVWVLDPARRCAAVYRSLTDVREVGPDGSLDGEDVLPGFSVPLKDLYR